MQAWLNNTHNFIFTHFLKNVSSFLVKIVVLNSTLCKGNRHYVQSRRITAPRHPPKCSQTTNSRMHQGFSIHVY